MKKFEKIVIASDLDGTFFDNTSKPHRRNIEAVKYFTENGGHFTIATGRVPLQTLPAFPDVGDLTNMAAVTCNGACIYDFRVGEILKIYTVPFEDVKALADIIHTDHPEAAIRCGAEEYGFLCTPRDFENSYVHRDYLHNASMKKAVSEIEEWRDQSIFKIVVRAEEALATGILEDVRKRLGDRLSVTQSGKTILDVQKRGRDKGIALRELTDSLGEGYRLYTCGDYLNDLEMHAAADVSVCPSNAHPDVLKVCDMVLGTNDDGLIADLVEYLDKTL